MASLVSGADRLPVVHRPRQPFRPDVQGLRAVAVGLVLLSHAHVQGVTGGFVGVDVFFVISGFLITGLLLADADGGAVSLSRFYARRARRILPAATLVIVATGAASVHVLNFVLAKQVLTDSIWASFFAANVKFSRDGTDYFSHQAASPLQHFWSLAVEEQFYLVWPALLALTLFGIPALWNRRRRGAHRRPGRAPMPRGRVGLVLAAVGIVSLLQSIHQTATAPTAAYFSTFARAWELVAGALLATGLPLLQRLPMTVRTLLTWAGVAGIGVAAVVFDARTAFPGTAALLPVLATCAVLAGGIGAPRFGANRLLGRQPLRFVGDISYSLYLWHWPLLILGAEYAGHALSTTQNLMLVAAAVLLSLASYFGVENPLRRSVRLWGRHPRRAMIMWPIAFSSVLLLATLGQPTDPTRQHPSASHSAVTGPASAQVKASVIAAEAGAPIPSGLSPSFAALRQDFKSIGDCSGYKKTKNKICQYGDAAGTKRVVLFGNSHSTMWTPALSPIARAAGWQLFPVVKEACDYGEFLGSARKKQCGVWYDWAKQQIQQLHPDLIVMSGDHGGPGWEQALTTALADMKSRSSRVLLVSETPGLRVSPFECLLRNKATLRDCTFPAQGYRVADDRIQSRMAAQAKIEFLSVRQWFCYQRLCPSVIGTIVAYADVGHITATFARHLIPDLGPRLGLG